MGGMTRPLAVLLVLSAASWSADLSKIERRIANAPRYTAATQYHALLVLGDDASYRAWLVVDGDTLYVDKNGDGDLRDPGERIQATGRVNDLRHREFEFSEQPVVSRPPRVPAG